MSDIQTDSPVIADAAPSPATAEPVVVTAPAPGLEGSGYTAPTLVDPAAPVVPEVVTPPAAPVGGLDPAYVRSELDMIRFSIISGVANGVERINQLMQYIEHRM
jgi:hypothetical protein